MELLIKKLTIVYTELDKDKIAKVKEIANTFIDKYLDLITGIKKKYPSKLDLINKELPENLFAATIQEVEVKVLFLFLHYNYSCIIK